MASTARLVFLQDGTIEADELIVWGIGCLVVWPFGVLVIWGEVQILFEIVFKDIVCHLHRLADSITLHESNIQIVMVEHGSQLGNVVTKPVERRLGQGGID